MLEGSRKNGPGTFKPSKIRAVRIKFEDNPDASLDLDPKGPAQADQPSRIFDKLVERASREMRSGLA